MAKNFSSISDFGNAIRAKKFNIAEAVESRFSVIDKTNDELNIFLTLFRERAEIKAKMLDRELFNGHDRGPLHGLPIAVKDIFAMSGYSPTAGSNGIVEFGHSSATVIERLEQAGAIILGTLNLDEYAAGGTGTNAWHGRCKNPCDPSCITGGSSSGSAAAVSAGFCLTTLGSDAGGSIRIPAAFCGVFGLKPTYGRVSRFGAVPRTWSMDCIGPIATNIEDLGLIFEVISGHDRLDATSSQQEKFVWLEQRSERQPRLALLSQPERYQKNLKQYRKTLLTFESHDCKLIEIEISKLKLYTEYHQRIVKSEAAAFHRKALTGEAPALSFEAESVIKGGADILAINYLQALSERGNLLREFVQLVFVDADVLVLPVSLEEAPYYQPITEKSANEIDEEFFAASIFTRFVNFLGLPAVTLPTGIGQNGMPTAIQLIAPPFNELMMLNLTIELQSKLTQTV
jgi:aspartyl-tRNA(Asn)/glutamyl-tRNA(Gln) amidotransferase subunit A